MHTDETVPSRGQQTSLPDFWLHSLLSLHLGGPSLASEGATERTALSPLISGGPREVIEQQVPLPQASGLLLAMVLPGGSQAASGGPKLSRAKEMGTFLKVGVAAVPVPCLLCGWRASSLP